MQWTALLPIGRGSLGTRLRITGLLHVAKFFFLSFQLNLLLICLLKFLSEIVFMSSNESLLFLL